MEPRIPAPKPRPERPPEATPALEPRQRWRLTYRRRPDAPPLPQRERLAEWEVGLIASGLPIAGLELGVPRLRVVHAAPLGADIPAERELVDIFLVERRPVAEVRSRIGASLPAGHELVDVHDVWLGEPPLSGQVVAADYRIEVDGSAEDRASLATAAVRLLGSTTLPRSRDKGGRSVTYDLRPLVAAIEVLEPGLPGSPIALRIRTRFDPERGVGRPEEVLAAMSEVIGTIFEAASTVRERLLLAGEA
jgi:hypothetical protein